MKQETLQKLKKSSMYIPLRCVYRYTYLPLKKIFYKNGWIRNFIIFPIIANLRVAKVPFFYNKYKEIEKFKDIHLGERCFIIATGPSLRLQDVEKLNNEYTFVVNTFYKIYKQTDFIASYYVTLEPGADKVFLRDGIFTPTKYCKYAAFMNDKDYGKYPGVVYLPVCYQNHYYKILEPKFQYSKNLKYSTNLLWGLYDKYTVTNGAIDIALYMGFKEIYLLGVDCNYSGNKQHFIQEKSDALWQDKSVAELQQNAMMAGYDFMEKETSKRGIKIYNATRGGMLESFERINFDSIIFK